jgi:hypothetical protein
MTESRSPLKDKPLRNPGQSVREELADLIYDKLFGPMMVAVVFAVWAGLEWWRYFFPAPPNPWLWTVVAVAAAAYAIWQFKQNLPKVRRLKLAEQGEKAVGQMLESLRTSGYSVFHDLIGDDFNVDHVIIGPAGIFTIETKTRRKPAQGDCRITFDGEILRVAGREPDRNPVIQAKAQASWLQRLLQESTGKNYSVRPVVLFPGWFIEDSRPNRRDLWVLEPKALPKFLANEKVQLPPEDVSLAASHLSRFVRADERRRESAG